MNAEMILYSAKLSFQKNTATLKVIINYFLFKATFVCHQWPVFVRPKAGVAREKS
jgi:hypothetical protein